MRLIKIIYIALYIFMFTGCDDSKSNTIGYIEDEYVYISTEIASEIKSIKINKGDEVSVGDILFEIDNYTLKKIHEKFEKNKKYEEAILKNIEKGIRQSEIDLIHLDIDRLGSEIIKAKSTLERKRKLQEKVLFLKKTLRANN